MQTTRWKWLGGNRSATPQLTAASAQLRRAQRLPTHLALLRELAIQERAVATLLLQLIVLALRVVGTVTDDAVVHIRRVLRVQTHRTTPSVVQLRYVAFLLQRRVVAPDATAHFRR